jgi:hypothetical protein
MVGNIGQAFQPYIGALIFGAFGWNTLFFVYAIAYLVAASMWLLIDPTQPFYHGIQLEEGNPEDVPVAEPA